MSPFVWRVMSFRVVTEDRRSRSLKRTSRSEGEVDTKIPRKTEPKVMVGLNWRPKRTLGESRGGTP